MLLKTKYDLDNAREQMVSLLTSRLEKCLFAQVQAVLQAVR